MDVMKVHVAGPLTGGNGGIDCSLDVLRSELQSVWSGAEISVAGVDERGISPTEHYASVLAGNGLLDGRTENSGADSLSQVLRYPTAMQWFDKKSFLLGAGVQGHLEPLTVEPYLPTLNRMQLRTVRDSESAATLREAGVTTPVLECADLSYLAPGVPSPACKDTNSDIRPILGIVVSGSGVEKVDAGSDSFEGRISEALDSLEHHFDIRFVSFDRRSGTWSSSSEHCMSDPSASPLSPGNGLGQAIRDMDLILTSDVHCIVVAASMGMPFVAIGTNGEDSQRECRALDHPFFLTLDAKADDIARAIQNVSDERPELKSRLTAAALGRVALARRTVQALGTHELEPESAALEVFRSQKEHSGNQRILLVWAAPNEFLTECTAAFSTFESFDVVTSPNRKLEHPAINEQFVLPQPGIMNWKAFPKELTGRLRGAYDGVVVCHPGMGTRPARNLSEIARTAVDRSGRFGCVEYRLWTQSAHTINLEELGKQPQLSVTAAT
jgi:hypothetical protein